MPKKIDQPLEVVTIKLFMGDRETLQKFYPLPVGYNAAIRAIVNKHCKKLRERESREGAENVAGTNPADLADDPSLDELIASAAGASLD